VTVNYDRSWANEPYVFKKVFFEKYLKEPLKEIFRNNQDIAGVILFYVLPFNGVFLWNKKFSSIFDFIKVLNLQPIEIYL